MLDRKLIKEASGNYGSEVYGVMPEHKRWILRELLSEMDEFYKYFGATGGGSYLELYRSEDEWKRSFYGRKPICTFKFAFGHSGLVESEFTKDRDLMNTEVFCDVGIGFWGCDTWYAYLADPIDIEDSSNPHMTD